VDIKPYFTILDVGCGGGQTIKTLSSRAPNGKVYGIDYSEESVAVSRETNRGAIERGQVDIQLGTVSQLPFADGTFDVVTAIETHYYWPDLDANVREVLRVLKPGGTFALIAETARDRQPNPLYHAVMALLRAAHLTTAQHTDLLTRAGFTDVSVDTKKSGWICATGRRPLSSGSQLPSNRE